MGNKFYNDAIIGNKNITASYSNKGELLRIYYPTVDYRQFIDFYYTGIKVNDSSLIYLHDNVNNTYNQYYTEKTNILNTEIKNLYYKLDILQVDFVPINKDVLVKKYTFKNNNSINLDIEFIVHSKIIADGANSFGSKVLENGMIQYNHDYNIVTFSKNNIYKYQLKDSSNNILKGQLNGNKYIEIAKDSAVSYKVGSIEPGESKTLEIYLYMNDSSKIYDADEKILSSDSKVNHIDESLKDIEELIKVDYEKQLIIAKRFWIKYVNHHNTINLKDYPKDLAEKLENICIRTVLLLPLLTNSTTGGISAAIEVDEEKKISGGYSYCWTRDAVFITQALDILKMEKESDKFYKIFCKNTQNSEGMWEQRFYTNGNLAPCWGYQVDETASVIYGIYMHYMHEKNTKFLKDTYQMCQKAIKFLNHYIENIMEIDDDDDVVKQEISEKYRSYNNTYNKQSYDLWEMTQGVHLYSLSSIFGAYSAMIEINKEVECYYKENRVKLEELRNSTEKLEKYRREVKKYILKYLCTRETKTLKRNTNDDLMDISIIGSVVPFELFTPKEKKVLNTVEKLNLTLRTYTGGYLRYQNDTYAGGKNPWTITTLWMALYYKKAGDYKKVNECLEFIVNSASEHGFLAEQVNNSTMKPDWVIGLSWAHAMFIILMS